ncbi:hypothetical protein [Halomarina oriensis]|uniref:Uncharacterized protein n=1 Tax=Halomarina oriensis TaxID=671145 RepID=A0A6B0GRD9_9EURY|nr:hypothetical protein [Halomarina oriensis]MWG36179.1 hypothetical protein [Halomarina oriensis]
MTRAAVETELHDAIDATMDAVYEAFDVVSAVRGSAGGAVGSRAVDALLKRNRVLNERLVEPELDRYRRNARRQVTAMLDAVAAGDPVETRRAELLDASVYVEALREDAPTATRDAVESAVVDRFTRAGVAVTPLVESDETEFWAAARTELSRAGMDDLVAANFSFAPRMREFRDALAFETRLDPGAVLDSPLVAGLPTLAVDYTDESLRAMSRGETRVRRAYERAVDRRFEGDG